MGKRDGAPQKGPFHLGSNLRDDCEKMQCER